MLEMHRPKDRQKDPMKWQGSTNEQARKETTKRMTLYFIKVQRSRGVTALAQDKQRPHHPQIVQPRCDPRMKPWNLHKDLLPYPGHKEPSSQKTPSVLVLPTPSFGEQVKPLVFVPYASEVDAPPTICDLKIIILFTLSGVAFQSVLG